VASLGGELVREVQRVTLGDRLENGKAISSKAPVTQRQAELWHVGRRVLGCRFSEMTVNARGNYTVGPV
jgi:hypothetical protein